MAKQKIALIGYGCWGRKVFGYLRKSPCFDLACVHFRTLSGLSEKQVKDKYGDKFTGDVNRIWRDESIGSVFIATPVKTHFELVMTALEHNKNVLVEKPMTLSVSEADQIREYAGARRLKVLTDYIYTFSQGLQKAGQIIHSGEIGKVTAVSMTIRQLGRFAGLDVYAVLASHCLAVLNTFFPHVDFEFERRDLLHTDGVTTTGLVLFRSQIENITGYIEVGLNCPRREKRMIFYGDGGAVIYDPDSQSSLVKGPVEGGLVAQSEEYRFDEANNIARAIDAFHDVITADKPDNLDMSLDVTRMLEKLSSTQNVPECLQPENA